MALLIVSWKLSEPKGHLRYTKVKLYLGLGSVTPFIGVGLLGSVRFGLY